jgi:hypothetical protein
VRAVNRCRGRRLPQAPQGPKIVQLSLIEEGFASMTWQDCMK